ncbi:hypothetical protein AB97_5238 [Escherichia coli 1-110-08_S3_C1]|nr:hypothetical protein ECDEC5E_5355 [Escherichia coli DEC5E]ENC34673.1 hypothetical protein ECP029991710_4788 [Escherichia coli P0299917.10]ENC43333.1 hypothetical protein ECP02999172_4957 [Escherichia coli P0299917.2]ENC51698.1 hypothetical protein ECP02999174_4950 [Escherichia coli P0299917.4]ENC56178.1 hypothetical protein ECP02999175_4851 [Escherichia coli P0299917.5]ENC66148.1 hypothetical protein ECP02999176_4813 [Escherichia coli P0299917.6]EYE15574.1 hypothetical protein AB97_5358 [E
MFKKSHFIDISLEHADAVNTSRQHVLKKQISSTHSKNMLIP